MIRSAAMPPYERLLKNLAIVRKNLQRPMTLAEKILYSHLRNPAQGVVRGQTYLKLAPGLVN